MLDEVHRLQGKPIARDGPGTAHATADQLLTSSGVISSRLVTFRSLTELVEQNRWVLLQGQRQQRAVECQVSADWLKWEPGGQAACGIDSGVCWVPH
eukprot:1156749-Pelagomonas_calceolata.AAC.3